MAGRERVSGGQESVADLFAITYGHARMAVGGIERCLRAATAPDRESVRLNRTGYVLHWNARPAEDGDAITEARVNRIGEYGAEQLRLAAAWRRSNTSGIPDVPLAIAVAAGDGSMYRFIRMPLTERGAREDFYIVANGEMAGIRPVVPTPDQFPDDVPFFRGTQAISTCGPQADMLRRIVETATDQAYRMPK